MGEKIRLGIVCRIVGDIPGCVEAGTKDFENLDALDVDWLG